MTEAYAYAGKELDLFAQARHWRAYWARQIGPFVDGRVLEVGAGIGSTTAALCGRTTQRWVCLEPDARLAARIRDQIAAGRLPSRCEVQGGTIRDLAGADDPPAFETVLYVDVLEHIADDAGELERAAARLVPGGHLVVLGPAHGWLFSDFDAAVGHYRRYDRRRLRALTPAGLEVVRCRHLDSVGMLASLGNRLLLRRGEPSEAQIAFWDRRMVPLSRGLDPVLGYTVGRSVLMVWKRSA